MESLGIALVVEAARVHNVFRYSLEYYLNQDWGGPKLTSMVHLSVS